MSGLGEQHGISPRAFSPWQKASFENGAKPLDV